ncbi:hypothetical protein [Arthrobacter sp.]|uniref:hypothetical protein n=1 Tax=Arthrobacter sp. TaxID=1667 RepID=UPI002810FD30|nr:hypothetical protein [Arthrobacter sp.]
MTTLTGLCPTVQPSGFDAMLIRVGRWLVSTGEHLASRENTVADHSEYEDRVRDGMAIRHSGLWI